MSQTSTHPLGVIAAEVEAMARHRLTIAQTSRWMFSANAELGGVSPVQAIRAGRFQDARRAAANATPERR